MERTSQVLAMRALGSDWMGLARRLGQRFGEHATSAHIHDRFVADNGAAFKSETSDIERGFPRANQRVRKPWLDLKRLRLATPAHAATPRPSSWSAGPPLTMCPVRIGRFPRTTTSRGRGTRLRQTDWAISRTSIRHLPRGRQVTRCIKPPASIVQNSSARSSVRRSRQSVQSHAERSRATGNVGRREPSPTYSTNSMAARCAISASTAAR